MSEIHLGEPSSSATSASPRVRPAPSSANMPGPFFYAPSDDGTDENLLVLLHGLGDTHAPFAKLGKSLRLPQTAMLAVRAPERVPFLYEDEAYQWYPSFDDLGEPLARPDPTPALLFLGRVLAHLMAECGWRTERVHLFGYAQGGSVAVELAVDWWRRQLEAKAKAITGSDAEGAGEERALEAFGSIVSVSGPLLSYPTLSRLCRTPVLLAHRAPPAETALPAGSLAAFKKAFRAVVESKMGPQPPGMPSSRAEWEPIMRFWSERLGRRQVEGLYEVMSGLGS